MSAPAEQMLNVSVSQVEQLLLDGETVPDIAKEWSEPAGNVLAVYRRMQREGRLPVSGPSQVATKPPAPPVAGSRPLTSVPTQPATVQSDAPSVDALVSAAARSKSKRTQALGVRLDDLTGVIRSRLADERATAEKAAAEKAKREAAAAEVARLQRQLAEAKAKLRPARRASAPRDKASGTLICGQGCGKTFTRPGWQTRHEATCKGAAE